MRGNWNSMVINCSNCKNSVDFKINTVIRQRGKVTCPICNKAFIKYVK